MASSRSEDSSDISMVAMAADFSELNSPISSSALILAKICVSHLCRLGFDNRHPALAVLLKALVPPAILAEDVERKIVRQRKLAKLAIPKFNHATLPLG